jgi:hypothetical protein
LQGARKGPSHVVDLIVFETDFPRPPRSSLNDPKKWRKLSRSTSATTIGGNKQR